MLGLLPSVLAQSYRAMFFGFVITIGSHTWRIAAFESVKEKAPSAASQPASEQPVAGQREPAQPTTFSLRRPISRSPQSPPPGYQPAFPSIENGE